MKKLVIGSNRVELFGASSLDQVKEKEAHGNNLVQELIINVNFNKVVHHDFTSDTRFNKKVYHCVSTSDIHGHTSSIHSSRSSATMVVPQVILNFK